MHTIVTLLKTRDKEKLLKADSKRKKKIIYKGKLVLKQTTNLSSKTMEARSKGKNICKRLKEKYPVNLEFYT